MIDADTKIGTRVLVDQPGGAEWESRFVGLNTLGAPEIATVCDSNPHCCAWPYSFASLTPINDGPDWYKHSKFTIGQAVRFVYELSGFNGMHAGKLTDAVLVAPHIKPGDWIVFYPRHDNGCEITRCLNEKQMIVERTLDDDWLV